MLKMSESKTPEQLSFKTGSHEIAGKSVKDREKISFTPKKFREENKSNDFRQGIGGIMDGEVLHHPFNTELINLQMPDHRNAIEIKNGNDPRPESKKGHDLMTKEHHERVTREK